MTDRLTSAEIAALLNVGERSIRLRASNENWPYEERPVRGGRQRLYPVSALPEEIRIAFAAARFNDIQSRAASAAVGDHPAVGRGGTGRPAPASSEPLQGRRLERAEARRAIVAACDTFIKSGHLPGATGTAAFADLYNAGGLPALASAKAAVPHLCANSIANWRRRLAREGMAGLGGRHGRHRKGSGIIDSTPDLKDFIVGNLAARPHLDAAQLMRGLRARFADGRRLPAYRSLQRFVARWKEDNAVHLLAVADPDAHRSRHSVAFGQADERVVALNQLWEWDATPADAMCADGRHALVAVVDVWSRRAKVVVTPTSRSTAITAALRKAALAWGLPATIKGDNGKDFTSFHVTRALADLHIRFIACPPFEPQKKPHIERFFHTLSHQFLELLPGYVGHNVAERQAIRNRRSFAERREDGPTIETTLTAAELQARIDAWVADVYERQRHSSLGVSPFAKVASWRGPVARIEDERALDVLLAEAPDNKGVRTVGKKGIAVEGRHYIAPELAEHVQRKVMVRLDVTDLGRVYVHDAGDGRFICVAVAPEVLGIDRRPIAIAASWRNRAYTAANRKALKKLAKKACADDIADEILAAARRDAARIVAFPQAAVAHETPALAEALKAALADAPGEPARLTPIEEEAQARVRAGEIAPQAAAEPISDADWLRLVMAKPGDFDADQKTFALELWGIKENRLLLGLGITEEEGRRRILAGGPVENIGESACTPVLSTRQTSIAS